VPWMSVPRFSATSASTLDHVNCPPYNLSVKIRGAETCYLNAMIHDAELGVNFLNLFKNGVFARIFQQKG
jgi:hypothetical protein